jgi:RNA polymerase sigma-70 factor (ECF subfamily)
MLRTGCSGGEVDRELVVAAQQGDVEAFESLARVNGDRLYAIARLILRDADLAQDAVQETLVRAWRELPRLRDPARFEGWLRRLVVNACHDQLRARRRLVVDVREVTPESASCDDTARLADRDELERGFGRLKPEHRTVVVLHYYLGLDIPEIAECLGIPAGTAKSRLHYAMATLRAAIDADSRPTRFVEGGQLA